MAAQESAKFCELPLASTSLAPFDHDLPDASAMSDEGELSWQAPEDQGAHSQLKMPLAHILPCKYANADVTKMFPEFRRGKSLRFSRLFGPEKQSDRPQIWRGVKRRRNKDAASDRSGDKVEAEKKWKLDFASVPPPEMCESDDEGKLMKLIDEDKSSSKVVDGSSGGGDCLDVAPWRHGPAELWYNMLGVSESGENFDYGFKLKPKDEVDEDNRALLPGGPSSPSDDYSDDAFLMVTQQQWEDQVIWDGNDFKQEVMDKLDDKNNGAGWVPRGLQREWRVPTALVPSQSQVGLEGKKDETFYSILPFENEDLASGCWEDDIIWDAENMDKIPEPKVLTLDPNDENIFLEIPDDPDPSIHPRDIQSKDQMRKSRKLLDKVGILSGAPPEATKKSVKNPFNISNDEYYDPKMTQESALHMHMGGNLVRHSNPAANLLAPFFPTHMGPLKLHNFHRPALKRYSHGSVAHPGPHGVISLAKHIKSKAELREQERQASGGGEMFSMWTAEDLTGKDGELIMCEMSEEHPPLISQVGMASKIKNYYKRKPGKDQGAPEYEYGEMAYAHNSPFLGSLAPGQSLQSLENNLFRAPIYPHKPNETDFLVIRSRQNYFIREVDMLYTVGQMCPLLEVPGPNSKQASNFVRDFMHVFIYRLFWESTDCPRRIRMEDVRKAFPSHSESSIRRRINLIADFKRAGMDSKGWVIKPGFRLPTEDEIQAMVSPEQCCAFYSMAAAEQRLKDAGYGEKSLFSIDIDNDEEMQVKMDDEVKAAPWNTTHAFIHAMKQKCLLQLTGIADPTGCGEGFSYIRVPNKSQLSKDGSDKHPVRKNVTGTDADLRRLSLNTAKSLLKQMGVPVEHIRKLSRWEMIDAVRTMSTQQARAGEESMSKFARHGKFSITEHQEQYRVECQRIFDVQNKVLSSREVLSTDEGSSTDEDSSDIEEMGKNIEKMLANKTSISQLSYEREEAERRELQKMIMDEPVESVRDKNKPSKFSFYPKLSDQERQKPRDKGDETVSKVNMGSTESRFLKIYRTFRNAEGKEYVRLEIVRNQDVIDAYLRIRSSKDPSFIEQIATLGGDHKEELKREKRRLQEQLRRLKRNQTRDKMGNSASHKKLCKPKPELKKNSSMKCTACSSSGHMRTNKLCPLYQASVSLPSVRVAMTEEEEKIELNDDTLVNIEGTKVTLSKTLVKHANEMRRKSLVLRIPKGAVGTVKRRGAGTVRGHASLSKPLKSASKRHTDPLVTLSSIFEEILNEMRALPDTREFKYPVNRKSFPDYHKFVIRPMDLQTIRTSLWSHKYQSREEFLIDVNQIFENSSMYNGANSSLTLTAHQMLVLCTQRLLEKEKMLMWLEKTINPLLDDDHRVALSFIFENIVLKDLMTVPKSFYFHRPVNKKSVKDYYDMITRPMDLETILKNIKAQKYRHRKHFLDDVDLLHHNSIIYNGVDSEITMKAMEISKICRVKLQEYSEHLTRLEESIHAEQEAAGETGACASSGPLEHAESRPGNMDEVDGPDLINEDRVQQRPTQEYMDDNEDEELEFIDVENESSNEAHPFSQLHNSEEDSNVLMDDLQLSPEGSETSDDGASHVYFASKLSEDDSESESDVHEENQFSSALSDQEEGEHFGESGGLGGLFQSGGTAVNPSEEDMEVDENCDLLEEMSDAVAANTATGQDLDNDLAISESDDEEGEDNSGLWF